MCGPCAGLPGIYPPAGLRQGRRLYLTPLPRMRPRSPAGQHLAGPAEVSPLSSGPEGRAGARPDPSRHPMLAAGSPNARLLRELRERQTIYTSSGRAPAQRTTLRQTDSGSHRRPARTPRRTRQDPRLAEPTPGRRPARHAALIRRSSTWSLLRRAPAVPPTGDARHGAATSARAHVSPWNY